MPSVLSNYYGNLALTAMPKTLYLALHEGAPDITGSPANEVAGGGYVRQPVTMSNASNKTRVSTNAQKFSGMPACSISDLAVWDAISGGHLVFIIHLVIAIDVPESGQFSAAPGDVALTL